MQDSVVELSGRHCGNGDRRQFPTVSVQTPGFPYSERWGQNRLNDWQQPENWGYERDHYHHDATQVAMSSCSRSVGFGEVMFAAGVSNKGRGPRHFPNGENPKMEDFYECGKHLQPVSSRIQPLSQRCTSGLATAGNKPKVRRVTDIDKPSHQQSAGETFLEDSNGRQGRE